MYEGELSLWRNYMELGTRYLGEEQYHKAEDYYSEGLLKAYKLAVPEIIAFTLRLLATVRVRLGNLDFAERGFREALRICQEIQNTKGMAEAWAGLASISVIKGMLLEACKEYEQAINVYPSSSPQLRLGMLYADLGQVYAGLQDWINAQEAYTHAYEFCRKHDFLKGEAELDVLSGEMCFRQGLKNEAVNHLKHACQVFAQIAEAVSLATTLQYLALLYFDQNEMLLAFECQQRAVALCWRFDTREAFSESCYFLSKIVQFFENISEAKYYLELSILFYPLQDLDIAMRYQYMGELFHHTKDFGMAEFYYLKSLSLFESFRDEIRVEEVYEALIVLKKDQDRKEFDLDPQIELEKSQLLEGFPLVALIRLAEFYEKHRDFRDALECYWKTLKMARDAEVATDWIEKRVQQVSQRLRRKKK